MRDRGLAKGVVSFAAIVSLRLSSLLAQELPKSGDQSFDVEPPLLVQPRDTQRGSAESSQENTRAAERDPEKLSQELELARKSAAAGARLARNGVLSKLEAEQRALRVARLEAELAEAQLFAAQEQLRSAQMRFAGGQATQAEVDTMIAAVAKANAAAARAEQDYHQAQLDNAARNLRRQPQLLSLGSAHKSDVARAEAKLAQLQEGAAAAR